MKLADALRVKTITLTDYVERDYPCFCCSQMIPMRFDIDDIGKKAKQHANMCSRYLVELDEVNGLCYSI